jgi:hypothetical protein
MGTCVEVCAHTARGGVMLTSMYEGYCPGVPSTAARGIKKERGSISGAKSQSARASF